MPKQKLSSEDKDQDSDDALVPMARHVETALIENHRAFLDFLVRRVGDIATAEDILQNFTVKVLRKGSGLEKSESVIAWLYSVLRTTLIDHHRQETTQRRLETDFSISESITNQVDDRDLHEAICGCFERLLPTLKPDYSELLNRIDLQGAVPRVVAEDLGIDANTVRVRLHRARQALKHSLLLSCQTCAEHGCLDCDCS